MNLIDFLIEKCVFFHKVTPTELKLLLADLDLRIKTYQSEEIIFKQGQNANYLGIIISGKVQAQKVFASGKFLTIGLFTLGETIGESVVFSSKAQYPVDIVSQGKSQVLMLSKVDLLNMLQRDQKILLAFMKNISNRVYFLTQKIELLSLDTLRKKIAYYLLKLQKNEEKLTFNWPLNRFDLAAYLGTTRPSLSRELGLMSKEKIISFNRQQISILDLVGLQEILSE